MIQLKNNWIAASINGHANEILMFVSIIFIAMLTHGDIFSRGGYSDDFVFLKSTQNVGYIDAIIYWLQNFNMRVSASFSMPAAFSLLADDDNHHMYWWPMHLIGLISLSLIAYGINRTLSIFGVSLLSRFAALAFFVLFPGKAQAIFWPTAVFVYALPAASFMLGFWIYIRHASQGSGNIKNTTTSFLLMGFGALGIEQLLALLPIVFLIRQVFYKRTKPQTIVGLALISAVFSTYLASVVFGPGANRIKHFSEALSPLHILQVTQNIVSEFTIAPIKIILDRFYWDNYYSNGVIFGSVLSVTILSFGIAQLFKDSHKHKSQASNATLIWVASLALMSAFIAMSPFYMTSYFIPSRAYLVPAICMAFSIGAITELISIKKPMVFKLSILPSIVITFLSTMIVYAVVTMFWQNEYSKYWHMESSLIEQTKTSMSNQPNKSHLSILGVPRTYGPTESLISNYAAQAIVDWLYPNNSYTASVFDDPYCLLRSSDCPDHDYSNNKYIIYSNSRYIELEQYISDSKNTAPTPINQHNFAFTHNSTKSCRTCQILISEALSAPSLSIIALRIKIPRAITEKHRRLAIHMLDNHGTIYPHDVQIDKDWGFSEVGGIYVRTIILPYDKNIKSIELGFADMLKSPRTAKELVILSPRLPFDLYVH